MNNTPTSTSDLSELLRLTREHLTKAQELVDSVVRGSVVGARLQEILDDLDEQVMRDLRRGSSNNR